MGELKKTEGHMCQVIYDIVQIIRSIFVKKCPGSVTKSQNRTVTKNINVFTDI